jgi:hypothetical protein
MIRYPGTVPGYSNTVHTGPQDPRAKLIFFNFFYFLLKIKTIKLLSYGNF